MIHHPASSPLIGEAKPRTQRLPAECGAFGVSVTVVVVSDDDLDRLLEEPDVELTDEPAFNALRRAAKLGLIKPPVDVPPVDDLDYGR